MDVNIKKGNEMKDKSNNRIDNLGLKCKNVGV